MSRHGLVHAYGHVSLRLDEKRFLVSPPCPLGAVDTEDAGVIVTLDDPLPSEALPEVRIHREIYRKRTDVGGVCRVQSPAVMALSALGETPRVRHGLGSYFAPHSPLWPNVALVRDDNLAAELAEMMGINAGIVLAGNGSVTAAASLEHAACLAFFLEDAARLDLAILPVRTAGHKAREYSPEEAKGRAITAGGLFERMWQFLCFGDPEWQPTA